MGNKQGKKYQLQQQVDEDASVRSELNSEEAAMLKSQTTSAASPEHRASNVSPASRTPSEDSPELDDAVDDVECMRRKRWKGSPDKSIRLSTRVKTLLGKTPQEPNKLQRMIRASKSEQSRTRPAEITEDVLPRNNVRKPRTCTSSNGSHRHCLHVVPSTGSPSIPEKAHSAHSIRERGKQSLPKSSSLPALDPRHSAEHSDVSGRTDITDTPDAQTYQGCYASKTGAGFQTSLCFTIKTKSGQILYRLPMLAGEAIRMAHVARRQHVLANTELSQAYNAVDVNGERSVGEDPEAVIRGMNESISLLYRGRDVMGGGSQGDAGLFVDTFCWCGTCFGRPLPACRHRLVNREKLDEVISRMICWIRSHRQDIETLSDPCDIDLQKRQETIGSILKTIEQYGKYLEIKISSYFEQNPLKKDLAVDGDPRVSHSRAVASEYGKQWKEETQSFNLAQRIGRGFESLPRALQIKLGPWIFDRVREAGACQDKSALTEKHLLDKQNKNNMGKIETANDASSVFVSGETASSQYHPKSILNKLFDTAKSKICKSNERKSSDISNQYQKESCKGLITTESYQIRRPCRGSNQAKYISENFAERYKAQDRAIDLLEQKINQYKSQQICLNPEKTASGPDEVQTGKTKTNDKPEITRLNHQPEDIKVSKTEHNITPKIEHNTGSKTKHNLVPKTEHNIVPKTEHNRNKPDISTINKPEINHKANTNNKNKTMHKSDHDFDKNESATDSNRNKSNKRNRPIEDHKRNKSNNDITRDRTEKDLTKNISNTNARADKPDKDIIRNNQGKDQSRYNPETDGIDKELEIKHARNGAEVEQASKLAEVDNTKQKLPAAKQSGKKPRRCGDTVRPADVQSQHFITPVVDDFIDRGCKGGKGAGPQMRRDKGVAKQPKWSGNRKWRESQDGKHDKSDKAQRSECGQTDGEVERQGCRKVAGVAAAFRKMQVKGARLRTTHDRKATLNAPDIKE